MDAPTTFLSSFATLFSYVVLILAIYKLFEIAKELGEIKEVLRSGQRPAAKEGEGASQLGHELDSYADNLLRQVKSEIGTPPEPTVGKLRTPSLVPDLLVRDSLATDSAMSLVNGGTSNDSATPEEIRMLSAISNPGSAQSLPAAVAEQIPAPAPRPAVPPAARPAIARQTSPHQTSPTPTSAVQATVARPAVLPSRTEPVPTLAAAHLQQMEQELEFEPQYESVVSSPVSRLSPQLVESGARSEATRAKASRTGTLPAIQPAPTGAPLTNTLPRSLSHPGASNLATSNLGASNLAATTPSADPSRDALPRSLQASLPGAAAIAPRHPNQTPSQTPNQNNVAPLALPLKSIALKATDFQPGQGLPLRESSLREMPSPVARGMVQTSDFIARESNQAGSDPGVQPRAAQPTPAPHVMVPQASAQPQIVVKPTAALAVEPVTGVATAIAELPAFETSPVVDEPATSSLTTLPVLESAGAPIESTLSQLGQSQLQQALPQLSPAAAKPHLVELNSLKTNSMELNDVDLPTFLPHGRRNSDWSDPAL